MTFRAKRTTATTLIAEVLRIRDDFMTRRMICMALTGRASPNQVNAALFWLRKAGVVDVIIEADGTGWWYARPQEEDRRSRHHEERAIEGKRKPRRRKGEVK